MLTAMNLLLTFFIFADYNVFDYNVLFHHQLLW